MGVWALISALWGLGLGLCLWGSGVDVAVMHWLVAHYNQDVNDVMRVLGEVGKGSFQAAVCVFVGAGLWVMGLWGYGTWKYSVWLWCVPVFLVAGLVNIPLKMLFGRARPKEVLWNGVDPYAWHPFVMDAGFWSFPSGHAVSTFAIAVVLMVGFPRYKWWVLGAAVVLAASRFLAVTPHYMGDVVAGAGVGAAVALALVGVLRHRGWL